jgi:hypothetical protein
LIEWAEWTGGLLPEEVAERVAAGGVVLERKLWGHPDPSTRTGLATQEEENILLFYISKCLSLRSEFH